MSQFRIVEGVAGYYCYHLAVTGNYKSLCGRPVMNTCLSLKHWGQKNPYHMLSAKWCVQCSFPRCAVKYVEPRHGLARESLREMKEDGR